MTTVGTGDRRGALGTESIALGIATAVVALVSRATALLGPLIAYRFHLGSSTVGAIISGLGWVGVLVGLGAAVTGAVGMTRRDRPRVLAGIGFGIGATAVATYLLGLLSTALVVSTQVYR